MIDVHGNDVMSHRTTWRLAHDLGVDRCHYCRATFRPETPPTRDHVIPVARGGRRIDGIVLACELCNRARGCAPYDTYARLCRWEHVLSFLEDRPYRRPKLIARGSNAGVVSTLPPWVWDVIDV